MSYIIGKNVIFLIDKGSGYVPHVCAVTISIKTHSDTKDILTVTDGEWDKPRVQKKNYTLDFEGVTPWPLDQLTGYDAFDFLENQCQDVNFQYKIYYTTDGSTVIKMIKGIALVIDSDLSAGAENLMDSTFTCAGFGAYERFNSSSACAATLGTLAFAAQGLLFVNIHYTGLSGADTLAYSVDGSTRRTLLAMPASGDIVLITGVGMTPGPHTIQVWPVCANGEDGTSLSTDYTRT